MGQYESTPELSAQESLRTQISDADAQLCQRIYFDSFIGDESIDELLREQNESMAAATDDNITNTSPSPQSYSLQGEDASIKWHPSELLDKQIHTIFQYENFDKTIFIENSLAKKTWEAMTPALTLATKFLTTPELQGFWYHLMYGIPTTDEVTGKSYLKSSPLEADLVTAHADFDKLLMRLADQITFFWRPTKIGGHVEGGAEVFGTWSSSLWAVLQMFDNARGQEIQMRSTPAPTVQQACFSGYMGLSSRFLYHLLSRRSVTRASTLTNMRLQFKLACTICHELAHAVYQFRGLSPPECHVFQTDCANEIGLSWEFWAFGGIRPFCEISTESITPMRVKTWEFSYSSPSIWTEVHMHWIVAFFRKDTWDRLGEVIQNDLLRIPRPVGQPPVFYAHRYLSSAGFGEFRAVRYEHGKPQDTSLQAKADEVPPDLPVEEWFRRMRDLDVRRAVASMRWKEEPLLAPYDVVLGRVLTYVC
ncbi:hypothetical protein N0V90_003843 [Kalmusia sp. IMI 367209]|nr:hypothetical protein N0V90_003843 [Kalmusia sp. IMI 367209]